MIRTYRLGLAAVAVIVLTTNATHGLNNQPAVVQVRPISLDPIGPVGPEVPEIPCEPFIGTAGRPTLQGLALPNFTVTIQAAHVKLWNRDPFCDSFREPLGDRFSWKLTERPPGSTAALSETNTLNPTLLIDAPGTYEAVLTVCPESCQFGGTGPTLPPKELELRFTSPDHLPPEYHPVSPPSVRQGASCDLARGTCVGGPLTCESDHHCTAFGQPLFADDLLDVKCQFGGAVLDPQWVTLQEWRGPQDYVSAYGGMVQAVEGVVTRARISSMDNEFNHHSIDANWNVRLDRIYAHMKLGSGLSMHNEWETDVLPGSFQPSRADRVSMWGYLIVDCGHSFKTEVHPPVGMAVHRERAISIPADWVSSDLPDASGNPSNVGTGVYVPGIMTDIWFNRDAGEMIEGDRTGLHQPAVHVPTNCVPGQAGCFVFRGTPGRIGGGNDIEGLSPINAVFTFRIHLPRSPKAVLESVGVEDLQALPLYHEVVSGNVGANFVNFDVVTENADTAPDVTYLRVSVDLRGIETNTPWFRIASAWVYPDPDNWGLQQRRVRVDKLHVSNEADGFVRGKGDWRLWLQVNNSSADASGGPGGIPRQEWRKIIDYGVEDGCDFYFGVGCGQDEDFGGQPWSTGNPASQRDLGPDVLVFPGQAVEVHTSGYEEDWFGGDSLGVIDNVHYFPEKVVQPNACTVADSGIPSDIEAASPGNTGCGYFDMHYEVLDLGAVDDAVLSPAGQALHDAYSLHREECSGDDVCIDVPVLVADNPPPPPAGPAVVHPLDAIMEPGEPGGAIFDTELFEPREVEPDVLNALTVEQIHDVIVAGLETEPKEIEGLLTKMRATFDESRKRIGDEVLLDLELWKLALPEKQFQEHFGDLPPYELVPGTTDRKMKGAGKIVGRPGDMTHLELDLPCDPLRRPTRLDVHWGKEHHFELAHMFQVACEQEPEPMHTHSGRGIGRLDGELGFVAAWTVYDAGKAEDDIVRLRIFDRDGALVRDAIGELTGNVHASSPFPKWVWWVAVLILLLMLIVYFLKNYYGSRA